jgi:putative oxidoreductase
MEEFKKQAHWFLRLAIAAVFLFHGLTKFPTISAFASMLKLPWLIALAVPVCETLGAVLILVGGCVNDRGWTTPPGSLLIIPVMAGAIYMIHLGSGFSLHRSHPMGGIEFQVVLLACCSIFCLEAKTRSVFRMWRRAVFPGRPFLSGGI